MKHLLVNSRQALKVRVFLWGSIAACIGALYAAWSLAETYGLNPGDGGVLRPIGERLMAGGIVGGLGVAFAGGMIWYASLYAVRISRQRDQVEMETMAIFGTKTRNFSVSDFDGGSYHHGRMQSGRGQSVNAPWITLRVKGRRIPFIADVQAETFDRSALMKLARGSGK